MKRVGPLVIALCLLTGYLAGYVHRSFAILAQARALGQGREGLVPMPPRIPPVPNPPLYPDPPNKVIHWSFDDLQKAYEARLAYAAANPSNPTVPPGTRIPGPNTQEESFRNHMIRSQFRVKLDPPRPTGIPGVMSAYPGADQHQSLSDFEVISGGSGQMVVGGVIEYRRYGRKAGPGHCRGGEGANTDCSKTVVMTGEFNGPQIRDGHTYNIQTGDWVAVPPNLPHQYLPAAGKGLAYQSVKIYLFNHPGIRY